jgi:hypothetical protein
MNKPSYTRLFPVSVARKILKTYQEAIESAERLTYDDLVYYLAERDLNAGICMHLNHGYDRFVYYEGYFGNGCTLGRTPSICGNSTDTVESLQLRVDWLTKYINEGKTIIPKYATTKKN